MRDQLEFAIQFKLETPTVLSPAMQTFAEKHGTEKKRLTGCFIDGNRINDERRRAAASTWTRFIISQALTLPL